MSKPGGKISQVKTPESPVSPEHAAFLRKVKREIIIVRLSQLTILILAFALWEIFAQAKIVDPFITSQPSRIIKTIGTLYGEGVLFQHIGVTCLETVIGFLSLHQAGSFLITLITNE